MPRSGTPPRHTSALSRLLRRKFAPQGANAKDVEPGSYSPTVTMASVESDTPEVEMLTGGKLSQSVGELTFDTQDDASDSSESSSMEVDFYHNPTELSRLILNQKYGGALRRLKDSPKEASVWVCAKHVPTGVKAPDGAYVTRRLSLLTRDDLEQKAKPSRRNSSSCSLPVDSNFLYIIRQLPIHLACLNLRRTLDGTKKKLLNQLISKLILEYPDGAGEFDHRGRLPLHDALWYEASPSTISLFLTAIPGLIHSRDMRGNGLLDMIKDGSGLHKETIEKLLEKDEDFWQHAQTEVKRRMKGKRLKSSKPECLVTTRYQATQDNDDLLTPLGLEARTSVEKESLTDVPTSSCVALEPALTLKQAMKNVDIATVNLALQKLQLEKTNTEHVLRGQIKELQQQNASLSGKLSKMTTILEDVDTTDTGDNLMNLSTQETNLFVGDQINVEALLRFSSELIVRHEALCTRHFDQTAAMTRMRSILGAVQMEQSRQIPEGDEDNDDGSVILSGVISAASSMRSIVHD